jgi:prepilin-type N-terminal cleavage/methylation domain-containing protein
MKRASVKVPPLEGLRSRGSRFTSDIPPIIARAFTLVELLVVLCIVCLLAATLVPTLAGSRIGSQTFRCQNNNRQLAVAWKMYADDNGDRVVYSTGGDSIPSAPYVWSRSFMDFDPSNSGNWDTNVDIIKGPLWSYTSRDASIYRCPSDHSYVVTAAGVAKPRVRSFSMNLYTGGYAPATGSGPGTDGGYPSASAYRIFSKTTDLIAPGPANTFVFMDARPEPSPIFGTFFVSMAGFPNIPAQYTLYDLPGISHNLGASVTFADGRAEIHRWADSRTAPQLPIGFPASSFASPVNVDVAWLQAHATSPK